ncbi:MAG: prolyl oligopeptidase family serine peptidase [Oligosphaeraceae bacterium]|nr:prolyl oligopeptidase family serine peptidase [Oligosphaeraceae bacterium]
MQLPSVWQEGLTLYYDQLLRQQAAAAFRKNALPATASDWDAEALRAKIWAQLGCRVDHTLPLDVQITGEIRCPGYRIEKICYQSRKDFYVTGNLYIPDGEGPFPAVLNMHGHWQQGRLAARVQQRGHLLALSGYVCLCVDAFGSGERCSVHGEFEYHGHTLGGNLLQFGESLMGAQIVDNMRGIDLLCSLPYVDAQRIGATGASGGGNQTMWVAAMDTRIKAAVPVVSVGSFESYVMCANCICELLPNGLTFTEEGGILALVAPRALMPCNGMLDSNPAFAPAQMLRSLAEARKVYRALDAADQLSCFIFNQPHGYWPEVQEAMLGWFNLHLKGLGLGKPVTSLPEYQTLPEEDLMVFPKGQRPAKVCTIPEYCRRRQAEVAPTRRFSRERLSALLHLSPLYSPSLQELPAAGCWRRFTLSAADGTLLPLLLRPPQPGKGWVLLSAPNGKQELEGSKVLGAASESGLGLAILDVFACGENDLKNRPGTENRNYARALLWLGQVQQGKWVENYRLAEWAVQQLYPEAAIAAGGYRDTAVTALLFAALQDKPTDLYLEQAPQSLSYSPEKTKLFTLAYLIPGILGCADIPELLSAAGGTTVNLDPVP